MTLPIETQKLITRTCVYSGCDDPADDDSDYCGPHEAHERGRAANRQRRHRQKLADAGLCIAGCGRKVARRRGRDGKIMRRRCPKCRREHTKRVQGARAKACVTGDPRGVTGAATDGDSQWRADPGTNWIRFRGKGRRGRLTREEQIDEDMRDVTFAIEHLQEALQRLARLKERSVLDLPPIQREAAWRVAGEPLGQAGRIVDELAEKYA